MSLMYFCAWGFWHITRPQESAYIGNARGYFGAQKEVLVRAKRKINSVLKLVISLF